MMSSISVTSCFPPFYGINPLPLFLEIFIILVTYINCYKFIQLSNGCVVITSTACYLPAKPNEIIHLPGATSVV